MEFKQIIVGDYNASLCEILLSSTLLTGSRVKGTLENKKDGL